MQPKSSTRCWVMLGVSGLTCAMAVGQPPSSESPYAGLEAREIKALSPDQIESYQTGQGMSLALAAELNGFPGPKHVLEQRDSLDLTDTQLESTERVSETMKATATELGREIVASERELDRLFAAREIDTDSLSAQVAGIAELEGRLRVVHLQAHLQMMEILSTEQIGKYIMLRGYHGAENPHLHHAGGHNAEQ